MQVVELMESWTIDIRRSGSHAEYSVVRNLHNALDKIMKELAHRLIDGEACRKSGLAGALHTIRGVKPNEMG